MKIDRYDPNWDERVQSMELHPAGDYVEYGDYESAVSELQERVDKLQRIVNTVYDTVQGSVK
jgi:hypothetical protein